MEALWSDCPFTDAELSTVVSDIEMEEEEETTTPQQQSQEEEHHLVFEATYNFDKCDEVDSSWREVAPGLVHRHPYIPERQYKAAFHDHTPNVMYDSDHGDLRHALFWREELHRDRYNAQPQDPYEWELMFRTERKLRWKRPLQEDLQDWVTSEQDYLYQVCHYYCCDLLRSPNVLKYK